MRYCNFQKKNFSIKHDASTLGYKECMYVYIKGLAVLIQGKTH